MNEFTVVDLESLVKVLCIMKWHASPYQLYFWSVTSRVAWPPPTEAWRTLWTASKLLYRSDFMPQWNARYENTLINIKNIGIFSIQVIVEWMISIRRSPGWRNWWMPDQHLILIFRWKSHSLRSANTVSYHFWMMSEWISICWVWDSQVNSMII